MSQPTKSLVNSTVSDRRIVDCEISARFWCERLAVYAERMRKTADRYAIAASLLSTLTGLAVWSTLAASTLWPAVLAVSITAFATAVVAIIPKVKKYGECAQIAADLAPRYAHVLGELEDARSLSRDNPEAATCAQKAIEEFEEIKRAKDKLEPFPAQLQETINHLREEASLSALAHAA